MPGDPFVASRDGDRALALEAVRPETERPAAHRRLDVQGLRAVAVLLVVLFHAGLPFPGGFAGVDVFFVISGYVIIALLYWEVSHTDRISLPRFFARRVRRILPALALVTTLTVAGAWVWLSPLGTQQVTAQTAAGASLFYANWAIRASTGDYFAEAAHVNPLLHTWSLSVEEQFYLVFPTLLAVVWILARRRGRSGRAGVLALLSVLTVTSFVAAVWFTGPLAASSDTAAGWAFYGSVFRVWEFAIGGLVAVAVRRRPPVGDGALRAVGLLGIAAVAASAFVISGTTPFPGPWTLLPVLGTAAVIYAGSGTVRGVVPGLASRPMVRLGDLSYSWYLWHWPAIVFTSVLTTGSRPAVAVAAFASLIPAWLSFTLLEQPIRSSGLRGRRVVALGVVCIAVPLAAAGALAIHAERAVRAAEQVAAEQPEWRFGYPSTADRTPDDLFQAALLAQRGQWEVYGEPCLGGGKDEAVGRCTFFEAPGKPRALLVGDSHAGAYAPGFAAAARDLGYSVDVVTSSGCPFVRLPIARAGSIDTACEQRTDAVWDYIRKNPPALVALANRSPRSVSSPVRLADELEPGAHPPCVADPVTAECLDHDAAVAAWQAALRETADRLASLGVPFVVLQTVPEHENGLERCVVGTDVDLSCLQTPRAVSWDRRVNVISAEKDVAEEMGFAAFDPFDLFCGPEWCRQFIDGQFLYRNDDHLNPTGSEWLWRRLETVLADATVPSQAG